MTTTIHSTIFWSFFVISLTSPALTNGHSHPYMISFQSIDEWGWKHVCGGLLLTPDTVLTSGACGAFYWPYIDLYPIRIVAGISDIGAMGPEIQTVDLEKTNFEFHPNLSLVQESGGGRIFDYDFAIVHLQSNFTLNDQVQPFPFTGNNQQKHKGEPSGDCNYVTWGIPQSPSVGRELREVNLSILDHPLCVQEAPFDVSGQMICAQDGEEERLHFGQRGDPLFCRDEMGLSYLAGINSWNVHYFDEPTAPFKRGIFANMAHGRAWIESKLV